MIYLLTFGWLSTNYNCSLQSVFKHIRFTPIGNVFTRITLIVNRT